MSYLWQEQEPGSWSFWQYSGPQLFRLLPEHQKKGKSENNKPFIFPFMYHSHFLPSYTPGNQAMETTALPVSEIHFRHSFYCAITSKISYNTVRSPKFFVTALNLPSWWFSKKKEKNPHSIEWLFKTRWLFFPQVFQSSLFFKTILKIILQKPFTCLHSEVSCLLECVFQELYSSKPLLDWVYMPKVKKMPPMLALQKYSNKIFTQLAGKKNACLTVWIIQ